MKNACIIFLLSIIIILTGYGFSTGAAVSSKEERDTSGYLRIHVRADSNDEAAQAVKYLVRDAIVEQLTPLVAEYESKAEALAGIQSHLREIERTAARVLKENGFTYGATATLAVENFPTRVYGEYTLPSGEYSALIVCLGSGKGDNWWCVVYPPLCFTAPTGQNIVYKSKILEIIQKWKNA